MKKSIFFLLMSFCIILVACGQSEQLQSVIHDECKGASISYFGVAMKYPLTVTEAKKEYGLRYWSNGYFYTSVSGVNLLKRSAQGNFNLVYIRKDNDPNDDIVPEKIYQDRLVKGYTFTLRKGINYDSLKISLEKHFTGTFVRKRQILPKISAKFNYFPEYYFYEMQISPCIYMVLSDYGAGDLLLLSFYFDMSEEERSRFFH